MLTSPCGTAELEQTKRALKVCFLGQENRHQTRKSAQFNDQALGQHDPPILPASLWHRKVSSAAKISHSKRDILDRQALMAVLHSYNKYTNTRVHKLGL